MNEAKSRLENYHAVTFSCYSHSQMRENYVWLAFTHSTLAILCWCKPELSSLNLNYEIYRNKYIYKCVCLCVYAKKTYQLESTLTLTCWWCCWCWLLLLVEDFFTLFACSHMWIRDKINELKIMWLKFLHTTHTHTHAHFVMGQFSVQ